METVVSDREILFRKYVFFYYVRFLSFFEEIKVVVFLSTWGLRRVRMH